MERSSIVALRNEKGSYNQALELVFAWVIVALRNEKGSYNLPFPQFGSCVIVALRNEKGSYNHRRHHAEITRHCSTAK